MPEFNSIINRLFETRSRYCVAVLEKMPAQDAAIILSKVDAQDAANALAQVNAVAQIDIVKYMDDSAVAKITCKLNMDMLSFVLRRMDKDRIHNVLALVPQDLRKRAVVQLRYPAMSAGAIADPNVITLTPDTQVRDAVRIVNKNCDRMLYYVYLLDEEQKLRGVISIKQLIGLTKKGALSSVAYSNPVTIPASMPFATLAQHPAWRRFHALPVVDINNMFVGVVRHKQVHAIMDETARQRQTERSLQQALGELYWVGLTGLMLSPFTDYEGKTNSGQKNDSPEK